MENKKRIVINLILTLIYAFITFVFVLHHEIWADEAQVWQIVKNLSVFDLSLFKHLVNEGHPAFFYLLVMPFAKLNMSIFIMQILCWLSTVLSVFLLLQYSPFNKITKYSIITSAGFMYFFPVIARSYSILPLLVFLLALIYKERTKHPLLYSVLLALCANTHVIMFGFVFLFGIDFICENFVRIKNFGKQYIFSSLIIICGLFATIVQLAGSEASNGSIQFSFNNVLQSCVDVIIQFFGGAVSYIDTFMLHNMFTPPDMILFVVCSFILAALFIALLIELCFADKKTGIICALSIIFQLCIYVFAYSSLIYPTRIFSAFLILIFGCWAVFDTGKVVHKKFVNIILSLFFLVTVCNGIAFIEKDFKYNYSSSKNTAEFIKNNIDKNSLIIPTADAFGVGVYYYLPDYKFYSVYKHKEIKYMIWNKEKSFDNTNAHILFTKMLDSDIKKYNLKDKKIYILATNFMNTNNFEKYLPQQYKLLYISPPCFAIGEVFKIYEYKILK